MLGVIGGMGPGATADFFSKLLAATPAVCDEDHIPLVVISDPRVPSRTEALFHGGASPLPALLAIRDKLVAAGATLLAMPCNTAHAWFDGLAGDSPVPFVSIVDASCAALASIAPAGSRVGLVATRATLAAKIYDAQLDRLGYLPVLPTEQELAAAILPSIAAVKAGRSEAAGRMLAPAVQAMLDRGAAAVILACTETPMALDAIASPLRERCVDSTAALAVACSEQWQRRESG